MFRKRLIAQNRGLLTGLSIAAAIAFLCLGSDSLAWLGQSGPAPAINAQACSYDTTLSRLIIKGDNFQRGAMVSLKGPSSPIGINFISKFKSSVKLFVNNISEAAISGGVDVTVTNPDGVSSPTVHLLLSASDDGKLTEDDVKKVIAQAVAQGEASGLKATIAVVDKEGNILGIFAMNGARSDTVVTVPDRAPAGGFEGRAVPAVFAAISKAVTGSFLSSQGHSFTSRTASFIVQQHFPPGIEFQSSGPLFGVQFSQLLVCSDINPRSPLGLAADPGGIALYKNGVEAGGVGIEGDGLYTLDPDPSDNDQPVEELVARAATRGFETPPEIQGDRIIVNGIRFPFVNTAMPSAVSAQAFGQLNGQVVVIPGLAPGIRAAQPSTFTSVTIDSSAPAGRVDSRFFPFRSGSALSASDVQQIIAQAARQAFVTRAAIRQPENSAAEVNISVVDVDGSVLGVFSTKDAPIFGFDVCVQKARTAAFFSSAVAGARLRGAGFGAYVDAAQKDGLKLDGSVAFTDRAGGFLSRPFFPDGIDGSEHGPFSLPFDSFSPFNDGLQFDLLLKALNKALNQGVFSPGDCTGIPNIPNGLQIFPGSVPLYKNGRFAGAIGISGDGVDQDDLIASMGSAGFEAPADIRSDRIFVRGVRLPYVKFPRHPNR
ncbi:MAG TPA: heme-binding protein [Blastocatellia bacterium]|nr:heme-binding protein [Blastocatellia bacterium]